MDLNDKTELALKKVGNKWYAADGGKVYQLRVELLNEVTVDALTAQKDRLTTESSTLSDQATAMEAEISDLQSEFPDELGE